MSERAARPDAPAPLVITINGISRSIRTTRERSLLDCLRFELGLTGTKYGCGEGECGACTVLVDDAPVHACQVLTRDLAGRSVVTVEGLSRDGLNAVQRAFLEIGAFQCGFCTPGMIVTTTALLARASRPSDSEVRSALDGNLCRCCGYARILRAVRRAADLMTEHGSAKGAAP